MLPARPTHTNVPHPVSNLVGREADLIALRRLIVGDRRRMVTLLGVGGAGKTRLAVQVATDLLDEFPDGVWLVELAPAASPALVPRMVAGALGLVENGDVPIHETLLGSLRRKQALLLLDNCEHLIEACAKLAEQLLTACPALHILATSREPLRIDGERRYQVPPLAVPDLSSRVSYDTLAGTASVRLFLERAEALDSTFSLTEADAGALGRISALLDGIPLAIELAASQMNVLTVGQIAERLEGGFRVLAGGRRTAPTRQQAMGAALDWSYELLTPAEQALFRRLGTFAGGFDLEATGAIEGDGSRVLGDRDADRGISPPNTPDLSPVTLHVLGSLVDKSLVVAERVVAGSRYRLLEPVRQYAQHLLIGSGEHPDARARHAAYYAALAEQAAPMLRGPEQIAWLDRLEVERDNLRAALGWASEHGGVRAMLHLVVALGPYWEARGYLSEGRRWLDAALAASHGDGASDADRLPALLAAGRLAHWQVDLNGAETLLTEALAIARDLADRRAEGEALGWLSSVHWQQASYDRGLLLGEESLRLGHEVADAFGIAWALFTIGLILRATRQRDRARAVLDESVLRFRQLGDLRYAAIASTTLGWSALEAGEHNRAAHIFYECALTMRLVGDQQFIVYALRGLAHVANARGEPRRAVARLSASESLRQELGMRLPPRNQDGDQKLVASLRQQLAVSEYDDVYAEVEAMSLDQVLAEISESP